MFELTIAGRVVTGRGRGTGFTGLDWARRQFVSELGVDPFPGTLNLLLDVADELAKWVDLKRQPGLAVTAPQAHGCDARAYPVRVRGRLPAAIVYPEVAEYPADQLEVVAALPLRRTLALRDGDPLWLDVSTGVCTRTVIFDVDGTLVDSLDAFRLVAQRVATQFDVALDAATVRHVLNHHIPHFWDHVVPAERREREALVDAMMRETRRCWPQTLARHVRLFADTEATLHRLSERGATLGIVTGSEGSSLEPLREAGLLELFDAVVTGRDVRRGKPDPEGLLRCADLLGVAPGAAVYVGDSVADMRATHAAGMTPVAVLSGAGDCASLTGEGPERILHGVGQLPEILTLP